MNRNRPALGIALMLATTFVFAIQDGISKHLATAYGVVLIVMIRYWFFAVFVVAISTRQPGGLRQVARSRLYFWQALRGVLLVAEIVVMVTAFTRLGLVESQTIFATYPLLVAALSGPVLGESVGWRRWVAIAVGFCGLLLILRPTAGVFALDALIPLLSAAMFALYQLLTRYVSRQDGAGTSFFWTGIAGALAITAFGFGDLRPLAGFDWFWMTALGVTGALGHYLLIKALEAAEAAVVQPFAYFQMIFASIVGVLVFGEVIDFWTAVGAAVIMLAGIFTIVRGAKAG